jgi:alpha-tubulin suppressor-like RCC1 family protein
MRCEASVVGLMVKRLACVVVAVLASEASAQGLMTVKVWGSNYNGQMNTPPDLTGVTQVACGGAHTYALKNDGTIVGWGYNGNGEINTPTDLTRVVQVACGGFHTYALRNDNTIVGWGFNGFGETDTPISAIGVSQVACGLYYTYALKNDGTVVGWGNNVYGQINTPSNLTNVRQVACGDYHTYALKNDGTLVGWGRNNYGQTNTPDYLTGVAQIACGTWHTYALKIDGTLVGWGGYTIANSSNPKPYGETKTPSNLTGVTQVACGGSHTYALRNDNSIVGWGNNSSGQINTPSNLTGITHIACGVYHTVVLYEPDCNNDGMIDGDQLEQGLLPDLNNNFYPDACDIARGFEEDCDLNGTIDSYQQQTNLNYAVQSAQLGPIGYTSPRRADLTAPPFTLSDPVLTVTAKGDFSLPSESITVYLNGRFVGQVFTDTSADKNDCRASITRTITLDRAFFNEAINLSGGATSAVFEFVPTIAVSASQCPTGSWIQCRLEYMAAITGDCNANGLLDVCETRDFPDADANQNGIVDACEDYSLVFECAGDLDGSRAVDTGDMSLLLMNFGYAMPGDPNDLDGNGHIDTADVSLMLLSFGPCQ